MAQLLVVDDEPWIAELLVAALTAEGHVVDTAPHGAAALEKIRETSYDLIVSDILERPSKVQGVEGEPFPTDQPFPDRPCDIAADEPIVRPGSRRDERSQPRTVACVLAPPRAAPSSGAYTPVISA